MSHGAVDPLTRTVVEALVTRLETSGSRITYGDLAHKLRQDFDEDEARAWHYLDRPLGRIQEECLTLGLPSLPVMVVTAETMSPSEGYAKYYRELHPNDPRTDRQIVRDELDAVMQWQGWQPLLDRCRINHVFQGTRTKTQDEERKTARRTYDEGLRVIVDAHEEASRSSQARADCLRLQGTRCAVCGFDSQEVYGVPGIVHVHHKRPLAEWAGTEKTDPAEDLVPVCPNCHAFLHSKGRNQCYSIEEARTIYEKRAARHTAED